MSERLIKPIEQEEWMFKNPSKSISCTVARIRTPRTYIQDGKTTEITDGTTLGILHFSPGGISHFEYANTTYALFEWIKALGEVFAEIDRRTKLGDCLIPEFLFGRTNKNMALFTQRVGFSIIGVDAETHTVIGRTSVVKEKLSELTGRINMSLLGSRADREHRRYKNKNNTNYNPVKLPTPVVPSWLRRLPNHQIPPSQ